MNIKRKDKRKSLFIELYIKFKNIADVYEAFQKKRIDVSMKTLYNYKKNPEIYGICSRKMGLATKEEIGMELTDMIRSDVPIKAAKQKKDAIDTYAKMFGMNQPEKVDGKIEIEIRKI